MVSQGARFFGSRYTPNVSRKHTKNGAPVFLILSALKMLLCELVVFIDMNTYVLLEGRNFKAGLSPYKKISFYLLQ